MPAIVWKGQLTFGLVSIPVRLHKAARKERIPLRYVYRPPGQAAIASQPVISPSGLAALSLPARPSKHEAHQEIEQSAPAIPLSRLRQTLVTANEEQPVERAHVQRGYEVEHDQFVVIESEELRGLQRRTSTTMEIIRSVRLEEIDPVFFENSYYVSPDKGGEKPYALLFSALQETQHVALARVGMYGREHIIIVRPGKAGILAHTMFYMDEIRFENEYRADTSLVGPKEFQLAKTFLEAIQGPFAPDEFKDSYREELQQLISTKRDAQQVAVGTPAAQPREVVDILEALKKSIELHRKPPVAETSTVARKSVRRAAPIKKTRH